MADAPCPEFEWSARSKLCAYQKRITSQGPLCVFSDTTVMSTPMEVDPPAAAAKASGAGKEKPRFEVKKASILLEFTNAISVERGRFVGMG